MSQVENMNLHRNSLVEKSDFEFAHDGFKLQSTGTFYSWHEIEKISAYKVDLITIDDLRLDISFRESILTISEDIPGFTIFIEKLKEALPSIDQRWEETVIKPPFARNQTIIYSKEHRP